MAAKHQMRSLEEHKRELLARSEAYRQTMVVHGQELQQSMAWVPRAVTMAKTAAPLMAFGVPLLGMLLLRRKKHVPVPRTSKPPASKKGLLGMVLGGVEIYNRLRPVLTVFLQHRVRNSATARTQPQTKGA